jgi:hypothetical protein
VTGCAGWTGGGWKPPVGCWCPRPLAPWCDRHSRAQPAVRPLSRAGTAFGYTALARPGA